MTSQQELVNCSMVKTQINSRFKNGKIEIHVSLFVMQAMNVPHSNIPLTTTHANSSLSQQSQLVTKIPSKTFYATQNWMRKNRSTIAIQDTVKLLLRQLKLQMSTKRSLKQIRLNFANKLAKTIWSNAGTINS